jgi:formate dehydrogenase iron-sulfur subunit
MAVDANPIPGSNRLSGPLDDPSRDAGWDEHPQRVGFFTDTSICIGCKACEVACKEWNNVPEDGLTWTGQSYDNTGALGASTWRHVAFIEQAKPLGNQVTGNTPVDIGMPTRRPTDTSPVTDTNTIPLTAPEPGFPEFPDLTGPSTDRGDLRWLMSSDVCKHCTHAACLDVCPTGALFRTEHGTVVVQADVCNGCGYCIPACPYGVIERREGPKDAINVGVAQKCTLCYDRLGHDETPACAKACPTQSIQFGPLDELRERAAARVEQLHEAGVTDARLYGENPNDGVGGDGAFFLLLDEPEVYGFPPDPVVCTAALPQMWRHALAGSAVLVAGIAATFLGGRR